MVLILLAGGWRILMVSFEMELLLMGEMEVS